MNKKYFEDFDWIKKAENAKSLSYFSTKKNSFFSKELLKEFRLILKSSEDRFRLSLHNKSEDDLHSMIIAMKKDSYIYPHKHQKSESYQIIEGKALLIYFNDLGEIEKYTILSDKNSIVALVNKNKYHALISLEDTIYNETRLGPFIPQNDSIFAKWIKENKEEYMKNLVKSILGK